MPGPDRKTRAHEWHVSQTLVAILVVIGVVAALRATAAVTLPLVFAVFLIVVFWPIQRRLERRIPSGLAAVASLLIFLAVLAGFLWMLWESGEMISETIPQYQDRIDQLRQTVRTRLESIGISMDLSGQSGGFSIEQKAVDVVKRAFSFSGAFVLVIAFFVLGLLEVHDFREKVRRIVGAKGDEAWLKSVDRITSDFVRYVEVRTFVGLITGVLVGLLCWMIGLEFALVWGLTNFLLNYIPTLGSIVAVIPPVLWAAFQFGSPLKVLLVLAGVGGVQLIMGQYIDPLLQGRYLSLSPIVVLLAVAFWGWLWGIAGAFISIPIMVAVVNACEHFDRTQWIATLLADVDRSER